MGANQPESKGQGEFHLPSYLCYAEFTSSIMIIRVYFVDSAAISSGKKCQYQTLFQANLLHLSPLLSFPFLSPSLPYSNSVYSSLSHGRKVEGQPRILGDTPHWRGRGRGVGDGFGKDWGGALRHRSPWGGFSGTSGEQRTREVLGV